MQFLREDNRTSIAEIARNVNEIQRQLELIDPVVSGRAGMVEPAASLKRVGKMAFADGVNWDPLGIGVPCQVMWDGTMWVPVPGAFAPWGRKNMFINGDFDIWQRGTTFGVNTYTADRWYCGAVGTTAAPSRGVFTPGQTDVPGEPTSYIGINGINSVVGANNFLNFHQPIEGVRTFAGQTVTLSFYATAVGGVRNIGIEFYQYFGSGGAPSAPVSTPVGPIALTPAGAFKKYIVTATLPSISGKTIGTAGDDQLLVVFWLDSGSTYATRSSGIGQSQPGTGVAFARMQIERGGVATSFEKRLLAEELVLCQRYYESMSRRIWAGDVTINGIYYLSCPYIVGKRTYNPTIVITDLGNYAFPAGAALVNTKSYDTVEIYKQANLTATGGYYIAGITINAEF